MDRMIFILFCHSLGHQSWINMSICLKNNWHLCFLKNWIFDSPLYPSVHRRGRSGSDSPQRGAIKSNHSCSIAKTSNFFVCFDILRICQHILPSQPNQGASWLVEFLQPISHLSEELQIAIRKKVLQSISQLTVQKFKTETRKWLWPK